ncbi:MAG: prepilin-type N-terminal cleavage/methylation domain-containing protein [Ruminococcus sp.]|nr:prepilin-type N-terminal cleavage/methylation domain-containing protein [Ruminococcus sp.]
MENKKNLKGFTLVELIVVMAVFGIIMLGAMQFLDPVSRMMKGSSLQEANSATVDNIKRYFEGTLRYASSVYVYNGDLKEYSGSNPVLITGANEEERQKKAVTNFVDSYFRDKADSNNDPIKGEVHVMKIDNDNGGKITESLFNFEAGYTYYDWNSTTNLWDIPRIVSPSVMAVSVDQPVINDVYYKDYSIFATLGYNTVNAIHAGDVSALPTKVKDDQYFGRINPVEIDDGMGNLVPYTFSDNMFSFTFVTYKNDTDVSGNSLYHHIVDGDHVFGSPYSSSNATLALVNIKSGFCSNYNLSLNNRPVRRNGIGNGSIPYTPTTMVDELTGGNPPTHTPDGKWDYEALPYTPNSFTVYDPSNLAGGNNIYIIYTLPN